MKYNIAFQSKQAQCCSPLLRWRSLVKLGHMQTEKTFFEDIARLMTGAAGVIGDTTKQLEKQFQEQIELLLAKMELPTREELEAVKAMAAAARDENEVLKERITILEAKVDSNDSNNLSKKDASSAKKSKNNSSKKTKK